jgi:hypothetical protein
MPLAIMPVQNQVPVTGSDLPLLIHDRPRVCPTAFVKAIRLLCTQKHTNSLVNEIPRVRGLVQ